MLVSLLVLLVVLCIVCWIISILPLPDAPFPFKTLAYVVVGIIAIVYLLRFTGVSF